MKPLLLGMLLVLLLAGCGAGGEQKPAPRGPTTTPPPALVIFPTPPSGWRIHATPTFQLALPESWLPIALDESSLRARVRQTQTSNPDLARSLQTVLDSGQFKELEFYAADATARGIIPGITIAHSAPVGTTRSEDIAQQDAQALTKSIAGIKIISTLALVSVNGIDTAQVVYQIPAKSPSGETVTVAGIQYLFLVSPQDLYLVTVTGSAQDQTLVQTADRIGKSFVAVKR